MNNQLHNWHQQKTATITVGFSMPRYDAVANALPALSWDSLM
ncbi:MAG: hypothetical protein AAB424_00815 [Patescibacteria group bacterium]